MELACHNSGLGELSQMTVGIDSSKKNKNHISNATEAGGKHKPWALRHRTPISEHRRIARSMLAKRSWEHAGQKATLTSSPPCDTPSDG